MRYSEFSEIVAPVVVNIKDGSPYDILIMRGRNPGKASLANGYQIGVDGERNEVIRKYAYDFRLKWKTDIIFREAVLGCSGKRLGCYCKPKRCHGDVLVRFLDTLSSDGEQEALGVLLSIASGQW